MTLHAWHTCIWGVSPILCSSSQALSGWMGAFMHSYFHLSPEMFVQVQVQVLAGPLNDIQRLVPKPLPHCLGCVPRQCPVVQLEGEPSPQSEVLRTLEQVFIKDLSVLCTVHLCLDPDLSPSPCPLKDIPTAGCCYHHASL